MGIVFQSNQCESYLKEKCMKRFLLSTSLLSTALALTPLNSSLFGEENAPQQLPTSEMPQIQSVQMPKKKLELNLQIEPLNDDQQKAGLNIDDIRNSIVQKLQDDGISVNDSISQPMLTLRIRTIQSGLDYATFIQLTLQEASMLVRNRSTFNAVTWSQASLLSCRPEDLKKEVTDTLNAMSESFAKDFKKAFQNQVM